MMTLRILKVDVQNTGSSEFRLFPGTVSVILSLLSYPWTLQGCDQKGNPVGFLRCEGERGAVFDSLPESEKISDGAPHAAKLCNDRYSEPRNGWHGQFFSVRPEIWQASLSQLGISIFKF